MNYSIVYAHPNPQSFNHAILETLEASLRQKGEVVVRDLYALIFNPVLSAEELGGLQSNEIPQSIKEEQLHVQWADIIFFVFPLWWAGPPAILRGYMDRIFSKGFAYDFGADGLQRKLEGKKLQIITTIGESRENYEKSGMFNSLKQTMGDVLSDFTGIEILPIQYFTSVTVVSDGERKKMLEEVKTLASEI
jgi:NAD(P)H dehydrogenase (quinone)